MGGSVPPLTPVSSSGSGLREVSFSFYLHIRLSGPQGRDFAVCLGQCYSLCKAVYTLGPRRSTKITVLLILIEGDVYVVVPDKEQVDCSIAIVSKVLSGSLSLSLTSTHSLYRAQRECISFCLYWSLAA